MGVQDHRDETIRWVAANIVPHEAGVRAWLRRRGAAPPEIDDVIQEAYCRLAELPGVDHIQNGRAYFFATVRSILAHDARRDRIARFEPIEDAALGGLADEAPSPERVVGSRLQLRRVLDLVAALPPAYRHAVEARRVQGLSQKEAARYLGVTEKVVENNTRRGLSLVLRMLAGDPGASGGRIDSADHPRESRLHALH